VKERCKERIWKLAIAVLLLVLIFIPVIAARGVELSVNAPKEVEEGGTFEVSIDVEKIKDLNSGKFDLSFDSSVVNVTNVSDGTIDGTTIPAEMWIADEGVINVIVDIPGITGVSGSGNLAKVGFKVVGRNRDRSELVISNVQLVDDEAEFIEVGKLRGAEIKVVKAIEVTKEEEEGEEQPPDITAWDPTEEEVSSIEKESVTFKIEVDQEADISWQINGTEVKTEEGETKSEFKKDAEAGIWNVSVIATSTETGLSSMHTWIWSVTSTSTEAREETPTPTPTLASGVTPSPTPTLAPEETAKPAATPSSAEEKPKPTVTPTALPEEATPTPKPAVPGFEEVFAITAMSGIAYILLKTKRRGKEG